MLYLTSRLLDFMDERKAVWTRRHLASRIYERLKQSEVFSLPDDGYVLGEEQDGWKLWCEMDGAGVPVRRLPYPSIAMEYRARLPDDPEPLPCVTLVSEFGEWVEPILQGRDPAPFVGSVWFFQFSSPHKRAWMAFPLGLAIHSLCVPVTKNGNTDMPILTFQAWPASDGGFDERSVEQWAAEDADRIVTPFFEMTCALACKNVQTESIEAPISLNIARQRRGRRPFLAFRRLVLERADDRTSEGRGTHSSPALHLRRGHVRRLPGDRGFTWVNAHMVGKLRDGLVSKVYDATRLAK